MTRKSSCVRKIPRQHTTVRKHVDLGQGSTAAKAQRLVVRDGENCLVALVWWLKIMGMVPATYTTGKWKIYSLVSISHRLLGIKAYLPRPLSKTPRDAFLRV